MDEVVEQAMAKWPNVPHCFGWMGLSVRGHWYMRDAAAQAAGPFSSKHVGAKGSLLQHEKMIAFIGRNYGCDGIGQWFFQNGPQRVYVELESTPWVLRIGDDFCIHTHTGLPTLCTACFVDEQGWVYMSTPLGLGLVHTLDVVRVANAMESDRWPVTGVLRSDLPVLFSYVVSPAAQQHIALRQQ